MDILKFSIGYYFKNLFTIRLYVFFLFLTLIFLISCKHKVENKYQVDYDSCNKNELEKLVGRSLSDLVFDKRLKTRIFKIGDNVTTDYLPNRINIEIDNSEFIKRAYCG